MLGWCASLAFVSVGLAVQDRPGEVVLVDGKRYQGLVFQAMPWQPARSWIEGGGKGNGLFASRWLGAGDITLRFRLAIAKKDTTGAALLLGDSFFGLDGEKGNLFTSGPLFGGQVTPLPETARRIQAGKPFDLEVRRTGDTITFLIDAEVVHEAAIGSGKIGRFGLAPEKALLLVYRLSVAGDLEVPPRELPAPGFQPAIEAAIDRGVTWLLSRQLRDGSWQSDSISFPGGQTALCAYTLLRSGLASEHPSVARAVLNLSRATPSDTYSASLMLLAFEATADPAWHARMRVVLKDLLAWQDQGWWTYAPEAREGAPYNGSIPICDLSNTQYAVLGLRAAQHAGLEVPDAAWLGALEAALRLQEKEHDVEIPRQDGKNGTEPLTIAGFRYQPERGPSGSMTAAGVAIIHICRAALGKRIKGEVALAAARALQLGTSWLDQHFNLEQNFGDGEALNHHYYLYGLERVGTLLEVEKFGEHAWYVEGAQWLLKNQASDGTWAVRGFASSSWREVQEEIDTCFAILFLKRASRPTIKTSGGFVPREEPDADPTEAVRLRTFGRTSVVLWIGGLGEAVRQRQGGARIAAVEYLSGAQVIERVDGDPSKAWTDERYTVRHVFEQPGAYNVRARVQLSGSDTAVESKVVEVVSDGTFEPWMKTAAGARDRNLLLVQAPAATASSVNVRGQEPGQAIDGLESTLWACQADDPAPTLTLEWLRPVKADALVLNGACSRRQDLGNYDRIREVSVRLNKDKEPLVFALGKDELEPTVLALPKGAQVRKLEIRITAREPGGAWKGHAGFTEVALERRP